MLEVDIAEPLCVEGRPADEEGDNHSGKQQEHTPLVALLSRALTKSGVQCSISQFLGNVISY